jgi:hypothetical protein
MAELDPLIAEVLLKGDTEFLAKMKRIGTEGAESLEKLNTAFEHGVTGTNLATQAFLAFELAISGAAAALIDFVEKQTELSQRTVLLAQAFGTTAGQIQELERVFAGAGVKVEQFERFANRLTITVAREWPEITRSIREYANQNEAAQLRVTAAGLKIIDAQRRIGDNADEASSRSIRANNAIEAAYLKLQTAAQHAALEQQAAFQAVVGAALSVEAAQQRLATLEGRPPSEAEKKNLEIAQAQQSLDQARRSEQEARLAQQEKAAGAELKRRQLEQEFDDLRRKAAKQARDDIEQRAKDELALKEAIVARGEAEQRANRLALTNIASIRDVLDEVVKGNKGVKTTIDLTEVSVKNLKDAIIAQAAEHSKATTPTGYETLIQLSKTLSAATADQITEEQKLALVNTLAGTSMQALGASASEILHVLEHNTKELEHFSGVAKSLDTHEAKEAIEGFRGALAGLNLEISVLSQRFAIAVSPAFTTFLRGLETSLQSNNGVLHNFIDGLIAVKDAIVLTVGVIDNLITKVSSLLTFNLTFLTGLDLIKAAFIGIGVAITVALGPIAAWGVAIGLIIVAIGSLRDNWDAVTAAFSHAWERIKDNSVIVFFTAVLDIILKIAKGLLLIDQATSFKLPGGPATPTPETGGGHEAPVAGHAGGGPIRGPGSGTSDSVPIAASNGEFMMRTAAVQHFGEGFMHSINNLTFPGFAEGGLVPSPARLGGGGSGPTPASSTLNLTIGDRTFSGLRGPKSTIDALSSFAISRQTSAAGNQPSWVK